MNRSFSWRSALLLATLTMLVCLRSELFLRFPRLHFDSDQAVFGLMTDDLIAGHSIPTFAYGRRYMLAVGVWMAAPLFAIWGSSVFLLKLPMLILNLAVVVMLWIGLRRESLSRSGTAIAILPFAWPAVVTSSRLIEHAGGNIEPFVAVLAAYFLRNRAVWLGAALGIAFLNREFAVLGFLALLAIDVLEGELRARWKARLGSAAVMLATIASVRALAERFTRFKGPSPELGRPELANVLGFFQQQLPSLLGGRNQPLRDYNIVSSLSTGHWFVSLLLLGWLGLCLAMLRPSRRDLVGFPAYLVLVGGGQALGFLLFVRGPSDPMLLRYVLLALLAVVGLIALAWQRPALQFATLTVIGVCAISQLFDYAHLEREYAERVPSSDADLLVKALDRYDVHYAWADYWIAYDLTYATHHRLRIAPTYDDRIPRLRREVESHASEAIFVSKQPCAANGKALERVASFYLCPPATDAAIGNGESPAAERGASLALEH